MHELLGFPTLDLKGLAQVWPELAGLRPDIAEQIEIDGRYAGYLSRQEADIRAYRRDEALRLPETLDYDLVGALSAEVRSKLKAARPATLGAAARLSRRDACGAGSLVASCPPRRPTRRLSR